MSSYRIGGPVDLTFSASNVMTGTNVLTSQALDVSNYQSTAFQLSWTGTPTGTFAVLVSIDGVTYVDLGASSPNNPAGSPASGYLPVYGSGAKWMKLQYTNASGSGTLSGKAVSKTR